MSPVTRHASSWSSPACGDRTSWTTSCFLASRASGRSSQRHSTTPVRRAPRRSTSVRGRQVIVHTRLESTQLKGNLLGDPTERDIFVYLPPSYEQDPDERYATAYLLHAYGENAEQVV